MTTTVVLLAMISPTSGAVVNSLGFESPDYSAGNLQGQEGWQLAHIGPPSAGTAVVQSTIVESGSQAVQLDRSANSDDRWGVPVGPITPQRYVNIDWDMRVEQTTGPAGTFGPFLGVEAYDGNGIFGLLGSVGVDATTGDILYQIQDSGVLTETGTLAIFDQWQHYQIRLDYDTNQYTTYVDGGLLSTTGFVDRGDSGTDLDEFTDATISALLAQFDAASQALTGTAYFDNFLVTESNGADFDLDDDIDGTDFLIWQRGYGITDTAQPSDGDANVDLDVDVLDLNAWAAQFGTTSLVSAAAGVPEPATATLLILAGLTLSMLRSARLYGHGCRQLQKGRQMKLPPLGW